MDQRSPHSYHGLSTTTRVLHPLIATLVSPHPPLTHLLLAYLSAPRTPNLAAPAFGYPILLKLYSVSSHFGCVILSQQPLLVAFSCVSGPIKLSWFSTLFPFAKSIKLEFWATLLSPSATGLTYLLLDSLVLNTTFGLPAAHHKI